ncbi:MAG: translation initiation factor IF-5A [Candidatus Lokiarchaeota archaeon]|nr:translation initiation factor IF-5A [Candidatus Harpocratesius repetitus]
MARKSANNLKKGNYFINPDDGEPYLVLSNDHSKSGKHGHAKSRIGCVGLFTGKKKSLTMTADTTLDIPEIQKRQGQLIDINENDRTVQVMDLETYETFDIAYPLDEEDSETSKLHDLLDDRSIWGDVTVEFWTVVGRSFVTRIVLPK